MALKFYENADCTQGCNEAQKFEREEGGESFNTFTVTNLTGAQIGVIYKKSAGIFTKLYNVTDYSVTGDVITLVVALAAGEQLIVLPLGRFDMLFTGYSGSVRVVEISAWLKRDDQTKGYTNIQLASEKLDLTTQTLLTAAAVTFVDGVGSGFSGLTAGALVGMAVSHNGAFVGIATANTDTTVTIDNLEYDGAEAGSEVYTIGDLYFAVDADGAPGTYAKVINMSPIVNDTAVRVWIKFTATIGSQPSSLPNNGIRLSAVEYVL